MWPSHGRSEAEVIAYCTTKIEASLASKTCGGIANMSFAVELRGCIMDIQVRDMVRSDLDISLQIFCIYLIPGLATPKVITDVYFYKKYCLWSIIHANDSYDNESKPLTFKLCSNSEKQWHYCSTICSVTTHTDTHKLPYCLTLLPCPVKSRPTSGDFHDHLPPGIPISS